MLQAETNSSQLHPDSQTQYQNFLSKLNSNEARWFDPALPPILKSDLGTITFHLIPTVPRPVQAKLAGPLIPLILKAACFAFGNDAPSKVSYVVSEVPPEKRVRNDSVQNRIVDRRKPHHFRVENELYDNDHVARMKPPGLSVYLCLCRHADYDTNDCYPSYALIAKKCGITRPTVIKHIFRLANLGYIGIEHNFKNGEFTTNTFYILELP